MLDIGTKVKVIDSDMIYDKYTTMFKLMELYHNRVISDDANIDGEEGVIVAKAYHLDDPTLLLYGVRLTDQTEIVINTKGIKPVK